MQDIEENSENWIKNVNSSEADFFKQALDAANDGIIITDYRREDNPIVFVNASFEKLTGYSKEEILFRNCRFLQGKDRNQRGRDVIREAVEQGRACRVDLRNYKKDGTMFWNELSIAPLKNKEGKITHFIGVQKDITKQKDFEQLLFFQTHKDPLTNLLNRRGFALEAHEMIMLSKEKKNNMSLILLDIDNFKHINDSYGHSMGDDVLTETARLIRRNQKNSDLVVRYGGDEFIILLIEDAPFSFENWSHRFQENIQKLNSSRRFPFILSMSFGRAILPCNEDKALAEVIIEADQNMYKMKKEKKLIF